MSRDPLLWKNLYISLVTPHLEIWSPTKEMDIELIKKVKARATKIPHIMRNIRHEKTLAKWGNKRLEDMRVRWDLIEMYKYVNGLYDINWERNPMVNTQKARVLTRLNGIKIRRNTFK